MNEYLTTEELLGFIEEGYEDELWGLIPGYSNYYISTKGRVWNSNSGKFLKPCIDTHGYLYVQLCSNGERRHSSIHRLITEQFIPNPYNYPVVRHLDDNPLNNDVKNLAWGTQSDNIEDGIKNGCWDDRLRPIVVINNDTGIGYYYSSCAEASRDLGHDCSAFCRGLKEGFNVGGYRLEDAKEEYLYDGIQNGDVIRHLFPTRKIKRPNQSTKVKCTRCDNGEQITFNNIIEVVKFFDSPYGTIKTAIWGNRKHKGYYIEYVY